MRALEEIKGLIDSANFLSRFGTPLYLQVPMRCHRNSSEFRCLFIWRSVALAVSTLVCLLAGFQVIDFRPKSLVRSLSLLHRRTGQPLPPPPVAKRIKFSLPLHGTIVQDREFIKKRVARLSKFTDSTFPYACMQKIIIG